MLKELIYPIGPSIAYVPLTQGQFALIEVNDSAEVAKWNWHAFWNKKTSSFYAKSLLGTRLRVGMHEFLAGEKGKTVDHKNMNSLDNRKHGNLRSATRSQQAANRPSPKTNKSGLKGVSLCPHTGLWRAVIFVNGKQISLKRHHSKEAAHEAYKAAAMKYFGEFART